MYRIALVDLMKDSDKAFAVIDAGEAVIVTLDGSDYMRMVPVAGPDDNMEGPRNVG